MGSININHTEGTGYLVPLLLKTVYQGIVDNVTVDQIAELTSDHRGAVFGFLLSDFAFASLMWINTPYSVSKFNELIQGKLPGDRGRIQDMIDQEAYKYVS